MAHASTVIVIDPLEPIALLSVDNMLDNQYWRWCADETITDDGEFVPDDQLTYDNFQMGPDFVLPAGTRVRMDYLWGWMNGGGVSNTVDYTVILSGAAKVSNVVFFLLSYYHRTLSAAGVEGRFFFIEGVVENDGWVEIVWGT
jgi:hypothetical protein